MFKKSNRLTKSEFSEYFKAGRRHNTTHLTFVTHPYPRTKTAVVVGKKVAKSAVRRNVLKRRVYAALRKAHSTETNFGVVIVVVKPSFNSLPRKVAESFLQESIALVLKSA